MGQSLFLQYLRHGTITLLTIFATWDNHSSYNICNMGQSLFLQYLWHGTITLLTIFATWDNHSSYNICDMGQSLFLQYLRHGPITLLTLHKLAQYNLSSAKHSVTSQTWITGKYSAQEWDLLLLPKHVAYSIGVVPVSTDVHWHFTCLCQFLFSCPSVCVSFCPSVCLPACQPACPPPLSLSLFLSLTILDDSSHIVNEMLLTLVEGPQLLHTAMWHHPGYMFLLVRFDSQSWVAGELQNKINGHRNIWWYRW